MSTTPFFSIITASYNSEKTISDTIESVLNLDFQDFEYIIIDGNSSDSTLEVIQSFVPKFEVKGVSYKFISEKDFRKLIDEKKSLITPTTTFAEFIWHCDEIIALPFRMQSPNWLGSHLYSVQCGVCFYQN